MFEEIKNLWNDFVGYGDMTNILPAGLAKVLAGFYGLHSESDLLNNDTINPQFIIDNLNDRAPQNQIFAKHQQAFKIAASIIQSKNISLSLIEFRVLFTLCLSIDPQQISFSDDGTFTNDKIANTLVAVYQSDAPLSAFAESTFATNELQTFLDQDLVELTGELEKKSPIIAAPLPENNELSRFSNLLEKKITDLFEHEKTQLQQWESYCTDINITNYNLNRLNQSHAALMANSDLAALKTTLISQSAPQDDSTNEFHDAHEHQYDLTEAQQQLAVITALESIHTKMFPNHVISKDTLLGILEQVITMKNSDPSLSKYKDIELYLLYVLQEYFSGCTIATLASLSKSQQIPKRSYFKFFGIACILFATNHSPSRKAKNIIHKLNLLQQFSGALSMYTDAGVYNHSRLLELMLFSICASTTVLDETASCDEIAPVPSHLATSHWVTATILSIWYKQRHKTNIPQTFFEELYPKSETTLLDYQPPKPSENTYRDIPISLMQEAIELREVMHSDTKSPLLTYLLSKFSLSHDFTPLTHYKTLDIDTRLFFTAARLLAPNANIEEQRLLELKKGILSSSQSSLQAIILLYAALNCPDQQLLEQLIQNKDTAIQHLLPKFLIQQICGSKTNPNLWALEQKDELLATAYQQDDNQRPEVEIKLEASYDLISQVVHHLPAFSKLYDAIKKHSTQNEEHYSLLLGAAVSKPFCDKLTNPNTTKVDPWLDTFTAVFNINKNTNFNLNESPIAQKAIEISASAMGTTATELKNKPINTVLKVALPDFEPEKIQDKISQYSPLSTLKNSILKALSSHIILTSITTSMTCIVIAYGMLTIIGNTIASVYLAAAFFCIFILNISTQWIGTKIIVSRLNKSISSDQFSAQELCQDILYPNQTQSPAPPSYNSVPPN
ncbi:hypothetical protein OAT84_02580 [Gammaproteobacteria bacterium]|nr:hypothetical protein [Gammaproteobacteria bacterium]